FLSLSSNNVHKNYILGNGTFITGEVYEVDNKVLADLDILEDYPNLYKREKFEVRLLDGSTSTEEVWIYVISNFLPKLLNEEYYGNYVSSESHGRPFVPRHMRTEGLQPYYHEILA
uniref:Gamma-glutamylcyclotransferase family protein n=1 Tax=Diabrotica virgifera virgifera TaxID=50390 RepID=A0A6P7G465_DIAVI